MHITGDFSGLRPESLLDLLDPKIEETRGQFLDAIQEVRDYYDPAHNPVSGGNYPNRGDLLKLQMQLDQISSAVVAGELDAAAALWGLAPPIKQIPNKDRIEKERAEASLKEGEWLGKVKREEWPYDYDKSPRNALVEHLVGYWKDKTKSGRLMGSDLKALGLPETEIGLSLEGIKNVHDLVMQTVNRARENRTDGNGDEVMYAKISNHDGHTREICYYSFKSETKGDLRDGALVFTYDGKIITFMKADKKQALQNMKQDFNKDQKGNKRINIWDSGEKKLEVCYPQELQNKISGGQATK